MKIGFAGMTHLGFNSAVAAAEKGFEVICHDFNSDLMLKLACHELEIIEPNLPELLQKNAHKISFTTDLQDLRASDLVYIAPDVPTDDSGRSDFRQVETLVSQLDAILLPETTLIVLSQVSPGFTRGCGILKRQFFYQVETLIFGRAVERALYPERIIIGCANPQEILPKAYSEFLSSFQCPVLPMRYESAELAKISINMCLVSSVSVANTLAELCEHIGADWSEIAPALKLDKRIGQHAYLSPGLGISGGNLERDLRSVCSLADQHGSDSGVVRSWMKNSIYRRDWVFRVLYQEVLSLIDDPVIGILGLTYKANTHSIKNSPSVALIKNLKNCSTRVYDPIISVEQSVNSELDACEGVNVLILMTPWEQFYKLDPIQIKQKMRGRLVLDPYVVLNRSRCFSAGLRVLTLGVG